MSFAPCCGVCGRQQNLLRCASCKVIQYCSRDHQVADRTNHKPACNTVKKYRKQYDHEEQALSIHPGDFIIQADLFTNSVGHFWGILETRKYIRARYVLVEAILKINMFVAVKSVLDYFIDILRLCCSNNLGVRCNGRVLLCPKGRYTGVGILLAGG
jgi:hypothetical protein